MARAAIRRLPFDRQKALEIERLITAVVMSREYDAVHLTHGSAVFDIHTSISDGGVDGALK